MVDEVERLAARALLVPEPPLSDRTVVPDRLLMLGSERFVVDEVELLAAAAAGALLLL